VRVRGKGGRPTQFCRVFHPMLSMWCNWATANVYKIGHCCMEPRHERREGGKMSGNDHHAGRDGVKNESWLDRYHALEAAATAGPWVEGVSSGQCHINHKHGGDDCIYDWTIRPESGCISAVDPIVDLVGYDENGKILSDGDAALIAFLRNTAPKLARLKAAVDRLHLSGDAVIQRMSSFEPLSPVVPEVVEANAASEELRAACAELDGEGE